MPTKFGIHFNHQIYWAIFLLCCFSCQSSDEVPTSYTITPAFYHWKSKFLITNATKSSLEKANTSKIYLRCFDVKWDGVGRQPIPVAELQMDTMNLSGLEIIPVVFIQNKVMKHLLSADVESFGQHLLSKITTTITKLTNVSFSEVQLDCDWTQMTRENYFSLLTILRKQLHKDNKMLSITLRLHQYRYREQTGIPPADRVVLMFYNMGEVNNWKETNSILNIKKAIPYLEETEVYPLPIDFALPLFRWGCVFRNQKLIELLNDVDEKMLVDSTRFVKISDNHFEVLKSTYLEGYYLYKGDGIRLEKVTTEQLKKSVELLKKVRNTKTFSLIFYHLDERVFERFSVEEMITIAQHSF